MLNNRFTQIVAVIRIYLMVFMVSVIRHVLLWGVTIVGLSMFGTVVYAVDPTPTPIVITITESISVSDQAPDQNANTTIDESITVNDDSQVSGTAISENITVSAVVTPIVESMPTATATSVPTATPVVAKKSEKEKEICSGRLNRDQKAACAASMGTLEKCEGRRLNAEQKEACRAAEKIVETCSDIETKEESTACTKAMKETESSDRKAEKSARDDPFSKSAGSVAESEDEVTAGSGSTWAVVYAIVAIALLALVGATLYRRKRRS